MNCAVHPDREASGYCRNCGKPMCGDCQHKVRDVLYCEDCLAQHVGLPPATPPAPGADAANPVPYVPPAQATAARHNGGPVVAFLLGFIPGLGAVYNGEYNKAIMHIVIFGLIILGIASDIGDGIRSFLIFLLVIFPFYMAIDAMRTAKAKVSGEPLSDPLENWSGQRPLGPIILIAVGVLFLLNNLDVFEFLHLRQLFLPLLLIGIGFLMLKNRVGGRG
ncbi:MAG TPA: B-box zinc finger protein [Candidatus Eisenbacteria bacterium]|nr:B-box zinc finger protein [Candidatus Eisenbacteria bacterium]